MMPRRAPDRNRARGPDRVRDVHDEHRFAPEAPASSDGKNVQRDRVSPQLRRTITTMIRPLPNGAIYTTRSERRRASL